MAKKASFDTLDHVMLKGQVTGVTRLSKKFKVLFLLGWLALLGFLIFAIFTIDSGEGSGDDSVAKNKLALEEEKPKAKDEPATGAAITHGVSNGNAALAKNGPTIDLSAALPSAPPFAASSSTASAPSKVSTAPATPTVIVPALDASHTPPQPPSPELLAKQRAIELRAQQRELALKSGSEVNGSGWESSSAKSVAAAPGSGLFSALAGSGASQPLNPNLLDSAAMGISAGASLALEEDQNKQARKEAFLRDAQTKAMPYYLPATRQAALSKYELKMGWKIPAFLIDGINSDLPGKVCAQVRENVYDSATGKYLLIPQGAKVCGTYDSQVALGQTRILMVWDRLIFDDPRNGGWTCPSRQFTGFPARRNDDAASMLLGGATTMGGRETSNWACSALTKWVTAFSPILPTKSTFFWRKQRSIAVSRMMAARSSWRACRAQIRPAMRVLMRRSITIIFGC